MKKIGLIALLGVGSHSATKLRWVDGDIDDDNDSFHVDPRGTVHSLMQVASSGQSVMQVDSSGKSDPFFPTNGMQGTLGEKKSQEQIIEEDLRSRQPMSFTDDKE
jgi:hypothetical protein